MAEISKEELQRRVHVVLQTWADEQDAGKPTFAPYDQWAACIEVLQSVEPFLARMAGPGEVICRLPPGYQVGADGQIEKIAAAIRART